MLAPQPRRRDQPRARHRWRTAAHLLGALAAGSLLGCWARPADPGTDSSPVRLTTQPAEDRSPAWSPDGELLLFTSQRTGNYEIYSMRADGSGIEQLTDHPAADESPAWAPGGDRIVFQSGRTDSPGLWILELPAGEPRLLLSDPSPELVPDWSPDGLSIAFMSKRDGNPELYRVAVESGEIERLTTEIYRDVWPRYEPDGRSLVFFSRRASGGEFDDLFRLDLETRGVTRITEHPTHHDFVPDVAPGGERIVAAMSDRKAGRRELVIFDSRGNVLERLADHYHRVFHPVWSPDGTRIAYAARTAEGQNADIYLIQVEPAPGTPE